jgi:hypothetical protein
MFSATKNQPNGKLNYWTSYTVLFSDIPVTKDIFSWFCQDPLFPVEESRIFKIIWT